MRTRSFIQRAALGVAASLCVASAIGAQASDYRIIQTLHLTGEGGWDYLSFETATKRLFIARGTRVQVVDATTGALLGEIADTQGVHGVALAVDQGKGYTSNGRGDSITVFDLASLKTLKVIQTPDGRNPDFIAYDATTKRVVAFNGAGRNASIVDAVSDRLVATVALGGKPESAVVDGRGRVFVDIEDRNEVVEIDLATGTVVARIALAGCEEPAGLGMDLAKRRLFVGCRNQRMVVVDADRRSVVASLPIGAGVDATAFDSGRGVAISSQGDGTVAIVGEGGDGRFVVRQTVATRRGARTMAVDPATHRIYLVTADFVETPAAEGATRPRRVMQPDTFTLIVLSDESQ